MDQELASVKEVAGRAPLRLLYCPSCHTRDKPGSLLHGNHQTAVFSYRWMCSLVCSNCDFQWHVCTECCSCRSPFTTSKAIRRHHKRKHEKANVDSDKERKVRARPYCAPKSVLVVFGTKLEMYEIAFLPCQQGVPRRLWLYCV